MADNTVGIKVEVKESGADEAKRKVSDLGKTVKETGDHGKKFSEAFKEVKEKLGGMNETLPAGITGILDLGKSMASPIAAAGALAAALVALPGAIAANWGEKIDAMADLGAKMGLTANEAFHLSAVMKDAGLSVTALQDAGDRLARSMSKTGLEGKGMAKAFSDLGISADDANGQLRNNNDVMEELSAKYKAGALSTAEQAAMTQILGKNYREAVLAFEAAKVAAEEHNAAIEAGLGITKASVEATDHHEKTMRGLNTVFASIGAIMTEYVTPGFDKLIQRLIDSYKEGGLLAKAVEVLVFSFRSVGLVVTSVVDGFGHLIDAFKVINEALGTAQEGFAKIAKGDFAGAAVAFKNAWEKGVSGLKDVQRAAAIDDKKFYDGMKQNVADYGSVVSKTMDRIREENKKQDPKKLLNGGGGEAANTKDEKAESFKEDPWDKLISKLTSARMATAGLNKEQLLLQEIQSSTTFNSKTGEYEKTFTENAKKQAEAIAIVRDTMVGEANLSVGKLTEGLIKQGMATDGLNKVSLVKQELMKKEYALASQEEKDKAVAAALTLDEVEAKKVLIKSNQELRKTVEDYTNGLQDEFKQQSMNKRDYAEMIGMRKVDEQTRKTLEDLEQKGLLTLEKRNKLEEDALETKKQMHAATLRAQEADKDWLGGMNAALTEYVENADNKFKLSKDFATNAFKTMEDGLVNFAMTGKLNFADMAKSIIADLIRIQIRSAISGVFKLIGSGFTGGGGGGFGTGDAFGNMDIGGFLAEGGSAQANTNYIVGEKGPEILRMGSQSGSVVPNVALQGAANQGDFNVGGVTIIVQGGETNDETAAAMKKELLATMQQVADGRIANSRRPGGLLYA